MNEETVEEGKARRQHEAEQRAEELVETLSHFVNGMNSVQSDAFATALANEHPTLLGQIARVVGLGVMRRSVREPNWRSFDTYDRSCVNVGLSTPLPRHSDHDGRLDCSTVAGAELMARQSFI